MQLQYSDPEKLGDDWKMGVNLWNNDSERPL